MCIGDCPSLLRADQKKLKWIDLLASKNPAVFMNYVSEESSANAAYGYDSSTSEVFVTTCSRVQKLEEIVWYKSDNSDPV
jgi:hypothetical protein